MKITRLKLWTFRIELDSGAYIVNRRGRDWCFGPEDAPPTREAESLLEVLGLGLEPRSLVPQIIDQIVELLVEAGLCGDCAAGEEDE